MNTSFNPSFGFQFLEELECAMKISRHLERNMQRTNHSEEKRKFSGMVNFIRQEYIQGVIAG